MQQKFYNKIISFGIALIISLFALSAGAQNKTSPAVYLSTLTANISINAIVCGAVAVLDGRDPFKDATICGISAGVQYYGSILEQTNQPVLPAIGGQMVGISVRIINKTLQGRPSVIARYYNQDINIIDVMNIYVDSRPWLPSQEHIPLVPDITKYNSNHIIF